MASCCRTVARQLSNLTVSGTAPSYVQPHYYSLSSAMYPSSNPQPYSEYASQISHLQASQPPAGNNMSYWENTRNDAVRYLGENGNQCVHLSLRGVMADYMRCSGTARTRITSRRRSIGPRHPTPRTRQTPSLSRYSSIRCRPSPIQLRHPPASSRPHRLSRTRSAIRHRDPSQRSSTRRSRPCFSTTSSTSRVASWRRRRPRSTLTTTRTIIITTPARPADGKSWRRSRAPIL